MPSPRRCEPSTSGIPIRRPSTASRSYRVLWQDRKRRRADFHLAGPARAYREDQSILIAGCGTSQAAKHALRWPEARVTGIDFSATSVRHTEALKRKYDLDNLEIRQLAVERVGELGTTLRSDRLHGRSSSPRRSARRAGGAARRAGPRRRDAPDGVRAARADRHLHAAGVLPAASASPRPTKGFGELVTALGALPPGHPLEMLLREAPDFRNARGARRCAAAPARPRLFGAAAVRAARGGGADLRPLGLAGALQPALRRHGAHPAGRAARRLPPAEQYAAVELFRGTMLRHSVVVYRGRRPSGRASGQLRRRRAGATTCRFACPTRSAVQERLPPGVAAVLINRSHTYTDIYLPIDAREKRLFDAIDGKRTIGEIARARARTSKPRAPSSSGSTGTISSSSTRPAAMRRRASASTAA